VADALVLDPDLQGVALQRRILSKGMLLEGEVVARGRGKVNVIDYS
jgi:hypothetical protein